MSEVETKEPVKKKSVQKQLKELFENHPIEFNQFFASTQARKINHAELEKHFIDSNGAQYFRFPRKMSMPLERKGELTGYYTFLSSGLSGEEHLKIIEAEETILSEGIGKPETAAKLGALIVHKRKRLEMVIHPELFYNIAAIELIREDEEPTVFNNQIHMEKVMQFKTEVQNRNAYFFFQEIQLPSAIDFLRLSQAEFTTLWHESEVMIQSLKPILELLTLKKESLKTKKSSATS